MSRHEMTTSSLPRRGMLHVSAGELEHGSAQSVATGGVVDEGEVETHRGVAGTRDQLRTRVLREQHHASVVGEVRVPKLGMTVETEPTPDEGVEVLGEEVGEEEGPEL